MNKSYTFSRLARRTAGLVLLALWGSSAAQAQVVPNKAIQFDGSTKYGSTPTLNLSGAALSMECWVKFNSFKSSFPYITSIIGTEATGSTALLRSGDETQPAEQLQFVLQIAGVQQKLNSSTVLTVGTWYHVACTYDGTDMKIYLNGVLDCTQTSIGTVTSDDVFNFGRNYADSRILDGALDEVRVWSRTLTAAEILANRCQVASPHPGLVGLWRLDEGTGTTANDQSGNSNTATLISVVNTDWTSNTPTVCARPTAVSAASMVTSLQVVPSQNPVLGVQAEVEIRGAAGQSVMLQVVNMVGQVVLTQMVKPATTSEHFTLALPQAAGLYVVRASSTVGTASAKLLKQ